jgi:Cu(I)/Ag(I) efflux system membrane fusion protein
MRYFLGLVIAGAVLWAKPAPIIQQFNVTTVKVKRSEVTANVGKNFGYLRGDESQESIIALRFGGYVEKLRATETYQHISKGEVIAEVYSPEVLQAKDEYLSSLKYNAIRPNPGMVQSTKERLIYLGVPMSEITAIEKTGTAGSTTTVRSPVTGYIFDKKIDKGSAFGAMQPLFRVVRLDPIWLEMKFPPEQLEALQKVDSYEIRVTGFERPLYAKRGKIYPNTNPSESTLTMRLSLPNPSGKLFPGMYAAITPMMHTSGALVVPRSAVIRKKGKWFCFKKGGYEGEYEPVEVDAVAVGNDRYEIRSGLGEGDEVVANALFMIDSDAQINGNF